MQRLCVIRIEKVQHNFIHSMWKDLEVLMFNYILTSLLRADEIKHKILSHKKAFIQLQLCMYLTREFYLLNCVYACTYDQNLL